MEAIYPFYHRTVQCCFLYRRNINHVCYPRYYSSDILPHERPYRRHLCHPADPATKKQSRAIASAFSHRRSFCSLYRKYFRRPISIPNRNNPGVCRMRPCSNAQVMLASCPSHIFMRMVSRAYAVFALLFGFSFYIQDNNQQRKGKDFRLRFLWRLFILFIIGQFNA